VTQGIWGAEGRPGEADEGPGAGERSVEELVADLVLDKAILQEANKLGF